MSRSTLKKGRPAFSLIEVLFAIAFLVLVGVAMSSLNSAASRLTQTTELKQMALGLNEQSIALVALEKRTLGTNFETTYGACIGDGKTCYVRCPEQADQPCVLQTEPAAIQLGQSRLQFTTSVTIRPSGASGRYLVNASAAWGKGIQRQLTTAQIIE